MRYIELLIMLTVISVFSIGFQKFLKIDSNLNERNKEINKKTNACRFISESFKNTCEKKGFKDLYQWQKVCKEMWNLEYIGWSNSDKENSFISNKKIMYGNWVGNDFTGEVYWEDSNSE